MPRPHLMHLRAWHLALLAACASCTTCGEDLAVAPGTITGTVCQVNGRPAAGVEVTATVDTESRGTLTLANGTFTLENVPAGDARLALAGEGQAGRAPVPLVVRSDEVTTFADPRCTDATTVGRGCISGQVCNRHTGMRVSGGAVTVVLQDASFQDDTVLETTTDAMGEFQLCNLPEGAHVAVIRAPGFQRSYAAPVVAGMTTEVVPAAACTPFDPQQHCVITGRACDSGDPRGWLAGARVDAVLLDAMGMPVEPVQRAAQEEWTDAEGRYALWVKPAGRWRVEVRKGNFESSVVTECTAGSTVVLDEGTQCLQPGDCRFLVATGAFDRVQDVLGRVGVPAERVDLVDGNPTDLSDWALAAFGDASRLEAVCGVFLNCGVDESPFRGPLANASVVNNLRAWVLAGGTLYASDQAYDVIEALFPDKVDFLGDDATWNAAEVGLPGDLAAAVTDADLLAFLHQETPQQDTVQLNLAYQGWSVPARVDADVDVLLTATPTVCNNAESCTESRAAPGTPMTLRFPVGTLGGQVIFTSFHVEAPAMGGMSTSTPDTDRVMRFLMTL